jgi:phage terminase large subunit-like protein
MCVISNAGRDAGDSWQWLLREFARTSAGWHFRSLDGPRATWISAAALEEQRQVLPGNVYLRLVLNQWTTGGDALSGADIAACVTESNPMNGDEHGWRFCGGLDLSTKRDHSSLVILGSNNNTSRVRVALVKSWAPGPDGINLIDVRDTVIKEARRFRTEQILYDPHQAALLAMDATRERVKMVEMPFTGANCNLMASTILETFRSRRIDLYNDPQLITDISRLNIVEKSFGWKLEASRGSGGSHSDRAMAMAIALPAAIEAAGNPRRRMVVAGGCSDSSSSSDTPARRTLSGIGDRSSAGHALARRLGRNF